MNKSPSGFAPLNKTMGRPETQDNLREKIENIGNNFKNNENRGRNTERIQT